jgi:hypothetical protein
MTISFAYRRGSVENGDRVEVVSPSSDRALGDREHRDIVVGVVGPGSDGESDECLFDDAKERVQRSEVV